MKIGQIKPYEKNTKKHPAKQIKQVADSIREFGFNQPVVIDKNNVIIVGHGRLEAAKLLGLKDVPVIKVDLTEEQAKAYRLADNKLNESDWDMNLVIEELKGLSSEMLDLTGFDKDLIIEPDEKDDEVPPTPEVSQSVLGDLYELGQHRVLCGDSTQEEAVLRLMEGEKADVAIFDPPYGVDYSSKNEFLNKFDKGNRVQKAIENDSEADYRIWFGSWLKNLRGILNGVFYIFISGKEIHNLILAIQDNGFKYSQDIVWIKNNHVLGRLDYSTKHENILYGWIDTHDAKDIFNTTVIDDEEDIKSLNKYDLLRKIKELQNALKTSIVRVDKPIKSDLHPTMKPVSIISKFIFDSTFQNGKVLDLFLGSGSTLIASQKTGRICYGMELDPKYVDVIVQRYCDYVGDYKIKRNGKEITWQK